MLCIALALASLGLYAPEARADTSYDALTARMSSELNAYWLDPAAATPDGLMLRAIDPRGAVKGAIAEMDARIVDAATTVTVTSVTRGQTGDRIAVDVAVTWDIQLRTTGQTWTAKFTEPMVVEGEAVHRDSIAATPQPPEDSNASAGGLGVGPRANDDPAASKVDTGPGLVTQRSGKEKLNAAPAGATTPAASAESQR